MSDAAYELVVPVELPPGMTPEEFLSQTTVAWSRYSTVGTASYRVGVDLDKNPKFIGPKELRRVAA